MYKNYIKEGARGQRARRRGSEVEEPNEETIERSPVGYSEGRDIRPSSRLPEERRRRHDVDDEDEVPDSGDGGGPAPLFDAVSPSRDSRRERIAAAMHSRPRRI